MNLRALLGLYNKLSLEVEDLLNTQFGSSDVSGILFRIRQVLKKLDVIQDLQYSEIPDVVCLCGSTKFKDEFIKAQFDLTMAGNIVFSVGWFSHADKDQYFPTPEEKLKLDELHKRKIDLADAVFVINVGGYIGESTKSEIEYAIQTNKPIKYLEQIEYV